MTRRYCGTLSLRIEWDGHGYDPSYRGSITAATGERWAFDGLRLPAASIMPADCSEVFDEAAGAAVSFSSYYSHGNRGSATPHWAPPEDIADAIDEGMERDERREPMILRSPRRAARR